MSETQLELASGPAVDQQDVAWLEFTLKSKDRWMTAQELLALQGFAGEDDKRWLRALAAESEWIISGHKGYKHLEHASAEEATHAVHRLDSQAEKMKARAAVLSRNFERKPKS